jgi:hypothetical protein
LYLDCYDGVLDRVALFGRNVWRQRYVEARYVEARYVEAKIRGGSNRRVQRYAYVVIEATGRDDTLTIAVMDEGR